MVMLTEKTWDKINSRFLVFRHTCLVSARGYTIGTIIRFKEIENHSVHWIPNEQGERVSLSYSNCGRHPRLRQAYRNEEVKWVTNL